MLIDPESFLIFLSDSSDQPSTETQTDLGQGCLHMNIEGFYNFVAHLRVCCTVALD